MHGLASWVLVLLFTPGPAAAQPPPRWESDPRVQLERGREAWREGDASRAATRFRLAIDNAVARGDLVVAAESRWWLSRALARLGRLPEARRLLEGIVVEPAAPSGLREQAHARLRPSRPREETDSAWVVFGVLLGIEVVTVATGGLLYGLGGCDGAMRDGPACDAAFGLLLAGGLGWLLPAAVGLVLHVIQSADRGLTMSAPGVLRF